VALRKFVERMTKPVEQLDREELASWCDATGTVPIDQLEARRPVRASGEVRSVRIVPRAGADALEAIVSDGRASVTAVFLGRRKIMGISPGRRLVLEGVMARDGAERVMYNPIYTLI
jgi:hypothetical protein